MLATVASATLIGVEGRPISVEAHVSAGIPGVQRRRPARRLLSGGTRSGPGRHLVERPALAPAAGHRQPGPVQPPQRWGRSRSAYRRGPARGRRSADGRAGGWLGISRRAGPRRRPATSAGGCPAGGGRCPAGGRGSLALRRGSTIDGPPPGPQRARVCAPSLPSYGARRAGPSCRPRPLRPRPLTGARTWPRCVDSASDALPSSWPPPVATISCCAGLRGRARPCWPQRLPGLLPPLEAEEALEVTRIHSAGGLTLPPGGLVRRPPLRAPHHSASAVSLIGGGTAAMRPGEISCAHRGVLFLDELPRVRGRRPGHAPPASGGRGRPGVPGSGQRGLPGSVSPGRGHEPVSLWQRRSSGLVPMQRPGPGSLCEPGLGTAA